MQWYITAVKLHDTQVSALWSSLKLKTLTVLRSSPGPSSYHLASLHITHSLLALSSILSENSHTNFTHELLHVVAKHLNVSELCF